MFRRRVDNGGRATAALDLARREITVKWRPGHHFATSTAKRARHEPVLPPHRRRAPGGRLLRAAAPRWGKVQDGGVPPPETEIFLHFKLKLWIFTLLSSLFYIFNTVKFYTDYNVLVLDEDTWWRDLCCWTHHWLISLHLVLCLLNKKYCIHGLFILTKLLFFMWVRSETNIFVLMCK